MPCKTHRLMIRAVIVAAACGQGLPTISCASTFRVGVGPECSYPTLAMAIDAATATSEADLILVNQGAADTDQSLTIAAGTVAIVGGYESCTDPLVEEDDRTVVSGRGGSSDPVFAIRGPANVFLGNLRIVDGLALDDGGGGINFRGSDLPSTTNILFLNNVEIESNAARNGGGLAAYSATNVPIDILLMDNVEFLQNTALEAGGGIYLSGDVHLKAVSPGLHFHRNRAGVGGAAYVTGRALADIGSLDTSGLGVFWQNYASDSGGAVAVVSEGVSVDPFPRVRLFSIDGANPLRLQNNNAASRGGAIFISSTDSAATLCASLVDIAGNSAPDGAVAYVSGGTLESGDVQACIDDLPLEAARSCEHTDGCNLIYDNAAEQQDPLNRSSGALIAVVDGGRVVLDSSTFAANRFSEALVRMEGSIESPSVARIESSVMSENNRERSSVGGLFLQQGNADLEIVLSSLGGNTTTSTAPLPLFFQETVNGDQPITRFLGSVAGDATEEFLLQFASANDAPVWVARNALTRAKSMQLDNIPSIVEGDPEFVDYSLRLSPSSPAIDFMSLDDVIAGSRDRNADPRGVDLPSHSDFRGPADLGAYELQQDPIVIFRAGFEGAVNR